MKRNLLPTPRALSCLLASISICFQFFFSLRISFSISWSAAILVGNYLRFYREECLFYLYFEVNFAKHSILVWHVSFQHFKEVVPLSSSTQYFWWWVRCHPYCDLFLCLLLSYVSFYLSFGVIFFVFIQLGVCCAS